MSDSMRNTFANSRRRSAAATISGRPFLLALFGVFVLVMLLALWLGLQGYRAIAEDRNTVDDQRLAYGSLVNTVKAFDAIDAFSVSEYEGNDVLSMQQRTASGTYIMLLYVHDGMLMQQYSVAVDVAVSPTKAHPLFATDTFHVDYANDLLTLTTDCVSPCIRLACQQPFLTHKLVQRSDGSPEAGGER